MDSGFGTELHMHIFMDHRIDVIFINLVTYDPNDEHESINNGSFHFVYVAKRVNLVVHCVP